MEVPLLFVKMHGLGNDFVVIGALDEMPLPEESLSDFARFVCDRHFGIGGDGVIWILPSQFADFKMRIFNPDGSEAEMCGNGIRCAAKWFYDRDYAKGNLVKVETMAGIKTVWIQASEGKANLMTVDMGKPIFEPSQIPTNLGDKKQAIEVSLNVEDVGSFIVSAVSMGNPHCVIFTKDVDSLPFESIGPKIEHHSAFPQRTNVEFVEVISPSELKVRVWERGVGLTLACGTGACASLVIAAKTGRTGRKAKVHLPGGDLMVEWHDDERVYMTGPANEVFHGEFLWRI